MKFDVVIGRAPRRGVENPRSGEPPAYACLAGAARRMSPQYVVMDVPDRWYNGGRGLAAMQEGMLRDRQVRRLIDREGDAGRPGSCTFLWERGTQGPCEVENARAGGTDVMVRELLEPGCEAFIRRNGFIGICRKAASHMEAPFSSLVSTSRTAFGEPSADMAAAPGAGAVKVFDIRKTFHVPREALPADASMIDAWKVFMLNNIALGPLPHQIVQRPFVGAPGTACTRALNAIGPFRSREEAESAAGYVCTRFFRFLVMLLKTTHHTIRGTYDLVPVQDFMAPWSDEMLYAKYGLSKEEAAFIEESVLPMRPLAEEETAAWPELDPERAGGTASREEEC